ncbi:MAG: hypothetical protein COC05_07105 [Gammaproteobacteria bacterium]|nr:MAG: hypothetical protein COC05_07105 [Gammaproteobacteria bacterium]
MRKQHFEQHYSSRIGWLRAVVLGANDGLISTASLVVGIAAANAARADLLLAAITGLVAGAMSMAAGEYVSVSSQADSETADLERERLELEIDVEFERDELASIYVDRGLDKELAARVAAQLMEHDALGAHARDELGLSDTHRARPVEAALASSTSFTAGAALPVLLVAVVPMDRIIMVIVVSTLVFLAVLGAIAAKIGGAGIAVGAGRVIFWGALAMVATAVIGYIFGAVV